jgi:hypothetical protein
MTHTTTTAPQTEFEAKRDLAYEAMRAHDQARRAFEDARMAEIEAGARAEVESFLRCVEEYGLEQARVLAQILVSHTVHAYVQGKRDGHDIGLR